MDENTIELLDIILNAIKVIIAAGGLCYGGWQLWDGFTNDQPQEKKKAVVVFIVTVAVFVVLTAARGVIVGMFKS